MFSWLEFQSAKMSHSWRKLHDISFRNSVEEKRVNVRRNYSNVSASVSYLDVWKHKAVISGPAVDC